MPPKAKKETVIFLINVGIPRKGVKNDSVVLDKAKIIVQREIERKIFFRPKDEIGIILMGSDITENAMCIENVQELTTIQVPNWDFVEEVQKLKPKDYCYNWAEAVYATLQYIQKNADKSSETKLIMLSAFNEDPDIISQFQADEVAKELSGQVQLLTIGEESLEERSADDLSPSELLLKAVHEKIGGQHITFDSAMSEVRFYKEPPIKPYPWYCTLDLADKKIPIASYVKVTDTKRLPSWKSAKDDQKVQRQTQYLDRQRCTYSKDETVTGYKYGGDFTAIGPEDVSAMKYEAGEKSYKIHSFASRDDIGLEYWCGNVTGIVLPSSQTAAKPFYSLAQAMKGRNLVAIVRKVYSRNSTPTMVALFPSIEVPDEPWCFVEIQLPFAEDRRVLDTKPIRSSLKRLSKEQNEAVDQLLDSLLINEEQDICITEDRQSYFPGCVPNPTLQHTFNMLAYRAINPNEPLPSMDNHLKEIFETPTVEERSKCYLQKIATLFDLENVDPKKEKAEARKKDEDREMNTSDVAKEQSNKAEDKTKSVSENDSIDEPILSLDTSDIDLDDLVANI